MVRGLRAESENYFHLGFKNNWKCTIEEAELFYGKNIQRLEWERHFFGVKGGTIIYKRKIKGNVNKKTREMD